MVKDQGVLDTSARWAWVTCTPDIARYYQWFLLEKGVRLQMSVWKAHITAIRASDDILVPETLRGKVIEFEYDPCAIFTNGNHWWIDVHSPQLEDLREDLGLPRQPFYDLHLTLGNEIERRWGCTFGRHLRRPDE